MELADSSEPLRLTPDRRPTIQEPPPVRVAAVEDVTMICPPGAEPELDAFYLDMLRFERDDVPPMLRREIEPTLGEGAPVVPPARAHRPLPQLADRAMQGPVYRAENVRLSFQVHEPLIARDGLRPIGIEVPSLVATMSELDQREIEYTRQRGLYPGQDSALVRDPGGNWLELSERRPV